MILNEWDELYFIKMIRTMNPVIPEQGLFNVDHSVIVILLKKNIFCIFLTSWCYVYLREASTELGMGLRILYL